MIKSIVSTVLRNTGMIYLSDYVRYLLHKILKRKKNSDFIKNNPGVKLPPDYLIYESFQLDYELYYNDGMDTAIWLIDLLKKHIEFDRIKVLDWGCGPGRIIRHLPIAAGGGCELYGTDYNSQSIAWCTDNLDGISFNKNELEAKLPYRNEYFDVIYGLSIITHLSEKMHYEWYSELLRVLKPGGVLLLTAQGENFKVKLAPSELQDFEKGLLVVRGKVKEGHRTYSAFHPKEFLKKLFKDVNVEEHIVRQPTGTYIPQDIWILRKKRNKIVLSHINSLIK